MSFLAPTFLALGLLIPIVVALYFIKSRPVRQVVPSDRLWAEVARRLQSNSLFQRYRHSMFLILQVLALTLGVLALARPVTRGPVPRVVIVLDRSASMRATDVAPSRFELAREAALAAVHALPADAAVALVLADGQVGLRHGFEAHPADVAATLTSVEPTDLPGPDPEMLAGVLADLLRQPVRTIHVFTDQLDGRWLCDRLPQASLEVTPFGKDTRNAALTRLDVMPARSAGGAKSTSRWAVHAVVTNFGSERVRARVKLSQKASLGEKVVEVPDKAEVGVSFGDLTLADGPLEASLAVEGPDHLQSDDRLWKIVGTGRTKVALVAHDPRALEKVLKSTRGIELTIVPAGYAGSPVIPSADVVITEGIDASLTRDRPALRFHAAAMGVAKTEVSPTQFDVTHPLLRYLSFKDVIFERPAVIPRQDRDQVVLGAPGVPLVIARNTLGTRQVDCGFTTRDTSFVYRVGFPIFVLNSLGWIAGARADSGGTLPTGTSVSLSSATGAVTLKDPVGLVVPSLARGAAQIPGATLNRAGLWTLVEGTRPRSLPMALQDFTESGLKPAQESPVIRVVAGPTDGPGRTSPWATLVLCALFLMVLEWALFARFGD